MASEMVIVEKIKILVIQFIALITKSMHLEQEFCSAHLLPGIEKTGKTLHQKRLVVMNSFGLICPNNHRNSLYKTHVATIHIDNVCACIYISRAIHCEYPGIN